MFSSLVAKCSPLLWFIFVRYFGLRSFLPRHAMLFEKTGIQVSLSFSSGISFGSMSCVQTGSVVHGGLLLNPGLQCHFVAWQIYKNQKCMCWSVCLTDQIFPRKMPKMYSTPIDLRQDQKMWVLVRRPLVKNSMAQVAIHRLPLGPWVALGWKFRHSELAIHSLTRGAISVRIKNKS